MSDFWQDRSVFITGCTGLLGSWMTQELVARGLVSLDSSGIGCHNLGCLRKDFPTKFTTVYGGIED